MVSTKGPDLINGLITNWIPLTTPGPASIEECSSAVYFFPGGTSSTSIIAFDPYYGKWIDPGVQCLATQHSLWWNQHSDGVTTDINLGPFNCPTGYATATSSAVNSLTTYIGCCPSTYAFQGTLLSAPTLGQCLSPLTLGQVVTAKTSPIDKGTWFATKTTVDVTQDIVGVHINGYIFNDQVETSSPTSPASVSASTTSTSNSIIATGTSPTVKYGSTLVNSSTSPSTSSALSKVSSGLGSGAKIGIGIGAGLLIIGVACAIIIFLCVRKRARRKKTMMDPVSRGIVEAPALSLHGGSNVGNKVDIRVPLVEAPGDSFVEKKTAGLHVSIAE